MVCNIGDRVYALSRNGGTHIPAVVIGGTPFGVTVELEDGTIVTSATHWVVPHLPEPVRF